MERPLFGGTKTAMVAVGLLAVFMIAIVWVNYLSQVDLRQASISQFTEYASREALDFSRFFSERRNDLVDLSSNREFSAYFENKALGMSLDYGLWASQVAIYELLERYQKNKVLRGRGIYDKLVFLNAEGIVLASSISVPDAPVRCPALDSPLFTPGIQNLFPLDRGQGMELIMTQPFMFHGERVGSIVAWLNTSEMLSLHMENGVGNPWGGLQYLRYENMLFSPLGDPPDVLVQEAGAGLLPGTGEIAEREYSIAEERSQGYLVASSPIRGTSFSLLTLTLREALVGSLAPWQLLLYTILLALLLLAGVGVILGMRARNLVLNARISETARMTRRIEEKNVLLQDEVAARKRAEEALRLANEDLEQRVEIRTSTLRRRSQELAHEIVERREAEATMRLIFNNTHDAIFIHDEQGEIIEVNERMLELFGMEHEDLARLSYPEDLSGPDTPLQILRMRWKQAMEGQEVMYEWTARRPGDGYLFDVAVALDRIDLGGKKVILATMHDISEQKRIHDQQEEHRKFLNTVFEGIGAAIFVFDPLKGEMVDCNTVGENLLSLPREEILSSSCRKKFVFVAGEEKDLLCPNWDDQDTFVEGLLSLPGRASLPISRQLFEVYIDGRSHLVQVVFDVTDRKNLERKLSIAQKLESIGLLASGIAHEINTPIQYVGDSIRFVQEAFGDIIGLLDLYGRIMSRNVQPADLEQIRQMEEEIDLEFLKEETPRACDRALEGVQRVATIVLAMKNFSHPGEEKIKAVDINKAIENTVTVTRNEWKYAADLETSLAPELPLVHCLPGGINQVLLNIIVNAAHAIEESAQEDGKGRISITTSHEDPFVEIRIQDSGCGISEENLGKVFDPFFTTKEVGKGTGQGLAIVYDIIVEKHGGSIDIESTLGKGTTFIIRLPAEDTGSAAISELEAEQ